ncbi:MAG: hypothetical protein M1814_001371 [Vezdaea aestivalis]|nr:MAG: hypothetical protein M1814_001371 [Vezdaea aestivalis]
MPGRQLCFLSLDGGGVRGVSTLQVLKHLMETIAFDAQLDFTPKPCEYFDLIGGTSTGGLIAIMLGRLKMDVQECMDAYVDMSDQIFQKKHNRVSVRGKFQGRFDSDELERCIKKIIRDHGFDENELLKDLPDASCKVFVCATSTLTSDTVLLTSYRRRRGGNDRLRHIKIWEACRATSAATSFFDSIHIQMGNVGEDFVDGATGANNPVHFLWNEALDLWHSESLEANLKCLVSIGTGVPSIEPFKDGLLEIGNTLAQISTDTETVAESFQRSYRHLGQSGQYFRFNVRNGLQDIGLEDAAQKDTIVSKTQKYIESQETFEQMGRCIANLAERECASQIFA